MEVIKDFFRRYDMENKTLTLQETKSYELEILKVFADYCNNKGLKYYLAYGTLLGAVRHGGFIPWDDDIDVWMPRPDYEKFIKLTGHNPITSNYETILYRDTRIKSIYPFVKIIDTRTVVIEETKIRKSKMGIWIDVFPLDALPDDESETLRMIKKSKKLQKFIGVAQSRLSSAKNIIKLILKIILFPYFKINGIKRFCRKLEKLCTKHDFSKSKYYGEITWSLDGYLKCPICDFEPATTVEFEGFSFSAPNNYKSVLEKYYGDYMTLPPENERSGHHFLAYRLK